MKLLRFRTLPLGVDMGARRVRMVLLESHATAGPRLVAAAARDLPAPSKTDDVLQREFVSAVLEELRDDLGVRERRAVLGIGGPASTVRIVEMPKMTGFERSRAARFEAERFAPWSFLDEPTLVRAERFERSSDRYVLGAVKKAVLQEQLSTIRMAGLRPMCVEHDAFAFRRVYGCDAAIVDVGSDRTTLHAGGSEDVYSWSVGAGGAGITTGIARDLGIDPASAERRKRILGIAGGGTEKRDALASAIAGMVRRARERSSITRVILTGNGARIPGLAPALHDLCGISAKMPVPEILRTGPYPDDVLRTAAPDWSLAAGLAMWSARN